jgi:hypothetical protein
MKQRSVDCLRRVSRHLTRCSDAQEVASPAASPAADSAAGSGSGTKFNGALTEAQLEGFVRNGFCTLHADVELSSAWSDATYRTAVAAREEAAEMDRQVARHGAPLSRDMEISGCMDVFQPFWHVLGLQTLGTFGCSWTKVYYSSHAWRGFFIAPAVAHSATTRTWAPGASSTTTGPAPPSSTRTLRSAAESATPSATRPPAGT